MSPGVKAPARAGTDRAAAVRAAMRALVARSGFHGASMGAVAREAGVATGTAYVHYGSKDELVIAAFVESKQRLGEAATQCRGRDRRPGRALSGPLARRLPLPAPRIRRRPDS